MRPSQGSLSSIALHDRMDAALQSQKEIGSQLKAVRHLSKNVVLQSTRWCEASKVAAAYEANA